MKKFEDGKKYSKGMLILAIGLLVAALLFGRDMGQWYAVSVLAAAVLFVCSIVVCVTFCRCPYCGRCIFFGVYTRSDCPHCHKDLHSGKKIKKK